jgi:hypothetical protein
MFANASRLGRFCCLGIIALLLAGCATAPPPVETGPKAWDFEEAVPGRMPAGWRVAQTNPTGEAVRWQVLIDDSAPIGPNVFALSESRAYNGTFNVAIADDGTWKDIDLMVRVKAVTGEEDQGGGPIWRCLDKDNYYICRFNPLESNYRVYVVEDGRRRQLETAFVETEPDRWYTLRVTMIGDAITCSLDGETMLEAIDDTFPDAGRVGLWAKADAVTSFDDLSVNATD